MVGNAIGMVQAGCIHGSLLPFPVPVGGVAGKVWLADDEAGRHALGGQRSKESQHAIVAAVHNPYVAGSFHGNVRGSVETLGAYASLPVRVPVGKVRLPKHHVSVVAVDELLGAWPA